MFFYQRSCFEHMHVDWNFMPVLVFARELPAGAIVGYDDLAKMQLLEPFVTPSLIKVSEVETLIGRRLHHPVERGDLVLHSSFEPTSGGWGQSPQ
jgi:Flp pilus assembly protein CpaB